MEHQMPLARHFLKICAIVSMLCACSTVPKESAKGKMVAVIKSPFAETCIQLAKIKYDGTPFIHDKELAVILKELTAQHKGNAVRYDVFTPGVTGVSNAKGRATAYRCHNEKLKKYISSVENKEFGEEEEDPAIQEETPAASAPSKSKAPKAPASKAAKSKTRPAPTDSSTIP